MPRGSSEFSRALAMHASSVATLPIGHPKRVADHQRMVDTRLVHDVKKALAKAPVMSAETKQRVIGLLNTVKVLDTPETDTPETNVKVAVPLRD